LNNLAYVGNDAVNRIDPFGLMDEGPCDKVCQDKRDRVNEIIVERQRQEAERAARAGTVQLISGGLGYIVYDINGDIDEIVTLGSEPNPPEFSRVGGGLFFHDFSITVNLRCSADNGFRAVQIVGGAPSASRFPEGSDAREGENLFGPGNIVNQTSDPESRRFINRTDENHIFFDGTTVLTVTPTGPNSSQLNVRGTGVHRSGYIAALNQHGGPPIFAGPISGIQRQCSAF